MFLVHKMEQWCHVVILLYGQLKKVKQVYSCTIVIPLYTMGSGVQEAHCFTFGKHTY